MCCKFEACSERIWHLLRFVRCYACFNIPVSLDFPVVVEVFHMLVNLVSETKNSSPHFGIFNLLWQEAGVYQSSHGHRGRTLLTDVSEIIVRGICASVDVLLTFRL